MYKYKIREGSFIDWARYGLSGLVLFVGLAALYMF